MPIQQNELLFFLQIILFEGQTKIIKTALDMIEVTINTLRVRTVE